MVFQRRAAQAQALTGIEVACGLGGLAVGVLDVLRFIENQHVEGLFFQQLQVPWQQRVGGQDQVVILKVACILMAIGAVQCQHLEVRGEVLGLVQPVGDQAGRHHR